jgi:hypothetical protein
MSIVNPAAALARERELEDTRHFEPVVDPTKNSYERMARKWQRYALVKQNIHIEL